MKTDLEAQKLRTDLTAGIEKAIQKMIERAKLLDEIIVVGDETGKVKHIRARDLK